MNQDKVAGSSLRVGFLTGMLSWALLVVAGCGQPVGDGTQQRPAASIPAGAATMLGIGVHSWAAYPGAHGFLVTGMDQLGSVVHKVHIRQFRTRFEQGGKVQHGSGYEIATSNGGILRATTQGHVLKHLGNPEVMSGLAVDMKIARDEQRGKVAHSCTVFDMIACAGNILDVIHQCGSFNTDCIVAVMGASGCSDCVEALLGTNSSGGQVFSPDWVEGFLEDIPSADLEEFVNEEADPWTDLGGLGDGGEGDGGGDGGGGGGGECYDESTGAPATDCEEELVEE